MPLTDEQLLAFDASDYLDYDEAAAREALSTHGDAFRSQLLAAIAIELWNDKLQDDRHEARLQTNSPDYLRGWTAALDNVLVYLRQGYFLPGGDLDPTDRVS